VPEQNIVLDTNVYISGFFWEGKPARILRDAAAGKYKVYISKPILAEMETVLKRDFGLNSSEVSRIISSITSFAIISDPAHTIDIIKEDISDNRILECGLACGAGFIVSGDQHLLRLKEFCGIRIVSPAEFLKRAE
jgi:uncharacterized protein